MSARNSLRWHGAAELADLTREAHRISAEVGALQEHELRAGVARLRRRIDEILTARRGNGQ